MVLYWTKLHSFVRSWAVELLSYFPIKVVAAKCNPSCTLPHSIWLSPWRQIQKNIHSWVCGPPVPPDLYSTQEGHPSWFPLVPSD